MTPPPADSSRVVVVAGATGLVGQHLLARLVRDTRIAHIIVVGRRAPALQDPRIVTRTVDFADVAGLRGLLQDALREVARTSIDDAYCCLGTTIRAAGSKAAFRAIDHGAVLAFADAARACGARRLLVVSSLGADAASTNFYLRTKGEADDDVTRLGYPLVVIARPSILDGPRVQSRPAERVGLVVMRGVASVLGTAWRYAPIHVDTVAAALHRAAFDAAAQDGVRVLPSDALQVLGRAAPAGG